MIKKYYLYNFLFSLCTMRLFALSIESKHSDLNHSLIAQMEIEHIKNYSYSFLQIDPAENEGFIAGTKVKTAHGFQSIEDLSADTMIIGLDSTATHKEKPIIHISKKLINQYVKISTEKEIISAGLHQKFYVLQKNQWVYAKDIKVSDLLFLHKADSSFVKNIEIIEQVTPLYMLTLENHIFFITPDDIMVHNAHLAISNTVALFHVGRIAIKYAASEIMATAVILGNRYRDQVKTGSIEKPQTHTISKITAIPERIAYEKMRTHLYGLRTDFLKIKKCLEALLKQNFPSNLIFSNTFLDAIKPEEIPELHLNISPEQELAYNDQQKEQLKVLRETELNLVEKQILEIQIALAFHINELIDARNKSLDQYTDLLPAISASIKEWNSTKQAMVDSIAIRHYEHIHAKGEDVLKNIEQKNKELKIAFQFYKHTHNGSLLKKTTNLSELINAEEKSIIATEQFIDKERTLNNDNQKIVEWYLFSRKIPLAPLLTTINLKIKEQRKIVTAKEISESVQRGMSIKPPEDPKKNDKDSFFESLKLRADKIAQSNKFGKIYRDPQTKLWWSKDRAHHGGSGYKVFKEGAKGFEWHYDADALGKEIVGKHKGPTGLFIPYKEVAF